MNEILDTREISPPVPCTFHISYFYPFVFAFWKKEIWYIRLRLNFNQQRDHRDGRVENVKRGVETGMDWFYSFFFFVLHYRIIGVNVSVG